MLISGKNILITGVCGTIGSALLKRLLSISSCDGVSIVGVDNNENQLFFLGQEYSANNRVSFYCVDIRDYYELSSRMASVDIVFHAAAMKHVVVSEMSPGQAVNTNILGVQNVIRAANENNVERVIFTSSDKAVNPTNVMGTTKLMGERLITAANNKVDSRTVFSSVRFGNVLGSNGSVIQVFMRQVINGGPVTLTDSLMTRFVMSIDDAVDLIITSVEEARGGEVFVTKMPVIRIKDLAEVMISTLAPKYNYIPDEIDVIEIGAKPGEKLYEELMSAEETQRAVELENYFSILPAFRDMYTDIKYDYKDVVSTQVSNPYISKDESCLSLGDIKTLMKTNLLLE